MSLQEIVAEWVDRNKGERFDLIVANRPFGGKIGEAPQTLTGFEIQGAILALKFETTERLVITKPVGVRVDGKSRFVVEDAEDVRFGHHAYDRPQVPENWCEDIYRRQPNGVEFFRLGPASPGNEFWKYDGNELVVLQK